MRSKQRKVSIFSSSIYLNFRESATQNNFGKEKQICFSIKMEFSGHHHQCCGQSLIPSFVYSSPSSSQRLSDFYSMTNSNNVGPLSQSSLSISTSSNGGSVSRSFVIPAPKEKIEMYSPAFYAACTVGGSLSTGPTHTAVTPMDLVKCNMQVHFLLLSFFW